MVDFRLVELRLDGLRLFAVVAVVSGFEGELFGEEFGELGEFADQRLGGLRFCV